MGRLKDGIDVEKFDWAGANSGPEDVGDKTIIKDSFKGRGRFSGITFVRYRFPGSEEKSVPPRDPKSPFIIVSFSGRSGRNCVIHRINKSRGEISGPKSLNHLWNLVENQLAKQGGLRVWTEGVTQRVISRELERRATEIARERGIEPTPEMMREAERFAGNRMKWQRFVESEGFSVRRWYDPKAPKVIRMIYPGYKAMLLRRPLKRRI
ncbi:MAG: hypothetical protein JXB14_05305 [Candidatus Altiarchaeota archaeon]|nr:hypothetical protein [Candidatus Altiarchaeota archaeon]